MVLLRWSVGAVGAGSAPGGAVGGARFGELCLGEGACTKSGLCRQGKGSRSRKEGRWGWQEAGWASEGWASEGWASEGWATGHGG